MAGITTSVAVGSAQITDGSIVNADINASAAIDATKIADGSVTSAEFQHLGNVTSDIQTQINAKAPAASPTFTGTVTFPATVSGPSSVVLTLPTASATLGVKPIISKASTAAGTAIGTGIVILDYGTVTDPSSRITTGASWKYTAAVNCTIRLTGSVRFTTAVRRLDLYINDTFTFVMNEVGVDVTVPISKTFDLDATQYFDLRADSGSASALFGDVKFNHLTIEEIPR